MGYQKLLSTVLQHSAADIAMITAQLQRTIDLTDQTVVQVVQQLPDFERIFNDVNALSMADRGRFLKRLEYITACEGVSVPAYIKPTATITTPTNELYFKRRDVIRIHFRGVGSEPDEPHFGVVWLDNPTQTDIVVIPTTSKYTMDYASEFSVGQIPGLPYTDTIIQIHKLSNISRKRIVLHSGKYIQGRVHNSYNDRLLHGMALVYGGETSLDHHVRNRPDMLLPDNLRLFQAKRFWPVRDVQLDPQTNILHFRKWNETTIQTLQMKLPNQQINKQLRLNIYDQAFGKKIDRANGFTNFGLYY